MFPQTREAIAIALFLAIGLLNSLAESPFKFDSTPGKLPKDVVPLHYDIHLQPDLEKFITTGKVDITIEIRMPVREIVLNALDMDITKAAITAPKTISLQPKANPEEQTVSFALPELLPPGKYTLSLQFTGHLREQAQGLFYVRYTAPAGKKLMLCTQLEATDARRMFPCWDEPVFRASFELTVVVPKKHLAVSNMPVKNEQSLGNGLKEVHFESTPPMASYLVVLASGELETLEGSVQGVHLRVVTTQGKKAQGRYALESAKKILGYYNDYFGVNYPLPKLDLIAVPGGFGGAMENWGGITFNEIRLLFDPSSNLDTAGGISASSRMRWRINGSAISSPWGGGTISGSTKALLPGCKRRPPTISIPMETWLDGRPEKSAVMAQDSLPSRIRFCSPSQTEPGDDAFDNITYIKGQSFSACWKTIWVKRISRRNPPLYETPRLLQHHHGGPVVGSGRSFRKTRQRPVGRVDRATGAARRQHQLRMHKWPGDGAAPTGTLHRPGPGRETVAMDGARRARRYFPAWNRANGTADRAIGDGDIFQLPGRD